MSIADLTQRLADLEREKAELAREHDEALKALEQLARAALQLYHSDRWFLVDDETDEAIELLRRHGKWREG